MRGFRIAAVSCLCLWIVTTTVGREASARSAPLPSAGMVAVADGVIPDDAGMRLYFRDDTDLNMRLRPIFEQELTAQGYRLDERGDLILSIETRVEEKPDADKPVTIIGRGGSRGRPEIGVQLQLPLFTWNSELSGRRYSLSVTLGRRNEPPVWVAAAEAVAGHGDRFDIQSALARALLEVLGQSVPARPIAIAP